MLLFFIFFSGFSLSVGVREIYDYEKTSNGMFKVGQNTNGKFEPYYLQSSKKFKITKSRTCKNDTFPHGMFIEKRTKTPMMLCETNQCKKLKEIQCEKNVSTENCNGFFQWISGFSSFKNGSSDISKVECCRYKELTFSTFVKFINFTLTEDYIHEITVDGGNLKAFEYLTNVQKVQTDNNSTVYSAAVFRMKCHSFFHSKFATISEIKEDLNYNLKYQNSTDAKTDAAKMRLKIAVIEKHLSGNKSFDVVLPSLEFSDLMKDLIDSFDSSTWPHEKKLNIISKIPNTDSSEERYMFEVAKYRLMAAEMVAKSSFGYYYKDMTLPIDRDEILKRYKFERIKSDIPEIKLMGNEAQIKTFVRNPIQYSDGILETDGGSVQVYERNAASYIKNPTEKWLVKHGDDFLGINNLKSFFSPLWVSFFNYQKVQLKDSCGKDLFPHGTYIDWTTNSLMMMCESHMCLNPDEIECVMKSEISSCNKSQEWVAGFKTKENDTVLEVECCYNKYFHPSEFIKEVIISNGQYYEHGLVLNGTKIKAFEFLNNFKMYKIDTQRLVKSLQSTCYEIKTAKNDIQILYAKKPFIRDGLE